MKRTSSLLAALAVLSLVLSPGLANARAGGGNSSGSRGSMTNSAPPATRTAPTTAEPMQRTMTPAAPTAAAGGAAMAPRSSLMSGMMGGLIGVGIGSLLMGGGLFGGLGGLGGLGFLSLLLQAALIGGAVWFLYRLFTRSRQPQQPAMAGGPAMFTPPQSQPAQTHGGGGSAGVTTPITVAPADFQQFEQLLQGVQAAWSAHDMNALRAMATPEMGGYFAEQLADQANRGVRNQVTEVKLESGDLAEAWTEQSREYATVAMRFSMVDCTRDTTGRVVDGNAEARAVATEIWTFVRVRGSNWILSAIQQTR